MINLKTFLFEFLSNASQCVDVRNPRIADRISKLLNKKVLVFWASQEVKTGFLSKQIVRKWRTLEKSPRVPDPGIWDTFFKTLNKKIKEFWTFQRNSGCFLSLKTVLKTGTLCLMITPLWAKSIHFHTAKGTFTYTVEIADTRPALKTGLSGRDFLAPHKGMLFDFQKAHYASLWMKDTLIPLDMIFIEQGKVRYLHEDAQPNDTRPIRSPIKVRYVVELNAGEIQKIGLQLGDTVDFK